MPIIFADNEHSKLEAIEKMKDSLSAYLGFVSKRMSKHDWIHCSGTKPTIADFVVAHFYFNLAQNSDADVHVKVAAEYCFKRYENVEKAMLWL